MRLESLILDCYGPFLRQELAFDPAPGRINLLVAPNGAGKSVLRGAFSDVLFDIGHQSPMTFAYPASRLRLTARLRLADGNTRVLVRRKGQGNTLSDGTAPIPPEELRALLGGADQYLFEALFALDSHALRRGGDELRHAAGRLGRMLFAGGGGLGPVRRLLEGLTEKRDAIGRADHRHIARPLWRAAADAAEAGRRLAQAALRPDAWQGMEKRAAEAERQLAELRDERVALDAELAGLTMLQAVRPWLARRDEALAVLAAAADAPRLEPGFETRWRRAVAEHVRSTAAAAERARQAGEAEAALAGQAPDTTLRQSAERIEGVLRDAITALNATDHLPRVEGDWHDAVVEVARLRRELGWEATTVLPPAPALRTARELLAARTGLVADAENAVRELKNAIQRVEHTKEDVEAHPPAEDIAALAALIREIRSAGDPARRLEAVRMARRDAETALAAALAALPEQRLTREQLADTTAPAEATLAAREATLTEAEAAWRDAQRVRDGLARERATAEAELAKLTREADLPEPGALAAARAERDRLWDAVCTGGGGVASVEFERALRHADAVADLMIAHATQVAEADARRRRIDDITDRHSAAEADCAAATTQLRRAQQGLAALAEAAGVSGGVTAAALRAFLAARDTALHRGVALDRARAEEADMAAALDEATRALARHGVAGDGLAAMLAAAEARVAGSREAEAARKAVLVETRKAARDLQDRGAAEARARQALETWMASWREAVAPLARPEGESPEATGAALELIDQLRALETSAAAAGVRIRDMRAAIDSFAAAIAALCARVAPDLAGLPPQQAAMRLQHRVREQHDAATLREADRRKRDAAVIAAAAADEKARAAAAEVRALRAALGVADDEAATAQLERVRRVGAAEQELAEARRHILTQGGGRTEAELDAMAAAGNAEAEAARIAALAGRQGEIGPLIEAASAEARSAADEWNRAGQGEEVQDAAARREAALATLARHVEEALVLHAAASLLRAGLEAGGDEEGSAAVARIGAVFRQLTCGAHAGVVVEDDGTDRVLVALEADGATGKQVFELSEGSRDQLFLALRIAALEAYVRANPPLPFIADDVLQTFDDARAAAALRALVGLSAHVQVIVLTHHPHVQALARSLPDGAVHTVMLAEAAEAA